MLGFLVRMLREEHLGVFNVNNNNNSNSCVQN